MQKNIESNPNPDSARSLPIGLQRYMVSSPEQLAPPTIIVASSPEMAWNKFRHQRFSDLKPARRDWAITLI